MRADKLDTPVRLEKACWRAREKYLLLILPKDKSKEKQLKMCLGN